MHVHNTGSRRAYRCQVLPLLQSPTARSPTRPSSTCSVRDAGIVTEPPRMEFEFHTGEASRPPYHSMIDVYPVASAVGGALAVPISDEFVAFSRAPAMRVNT
jgi:hypothetical protein